MSSSVCVSWTEGSMILRGGDAATFGRGGQGGTADIALSSDPNLSAIAGRIVVHDAGWMIESVNRWKPLRYSERDRIGEIHLPHLGVTDMGRKSVTIEIALDAERACELHVDVVPDSVATIAQPAASGTQTGIRFDERSLYFYTTVILCEPSLRARRITVTPTNKEIVKRLKELGHDPDATTEKVERRLEYARQKVQPSSSGPLRSRLGLDDRNARRRLVENVFDLGIVRSEHIALLERRDEGV